MPAPWNPKGTSCGAEPRSSRTSIGPHTVVWLIEAQHYLLPEPASLGERVAAALRELLRGLDPDRSRGPVLILATASRSTDR
jgi:hypothetical protein